MKIHSPLVTLAAVALATAAFAVDSTQPSRQLEIFPKNLARQHIGSNLFVFNSTNQTYVPTEAAAAWLDDDITTGWPAMAGKQDYLLVLSEPQVLTNFSLSARPAQGTISLYAGDEPTAPGSKAWKLIAKDVTFESVNNKKLPRSFSHLAKYVLIHTEIADPGPVYSLNVYGETPATRYSLRKREQSIDSHAIFGQYVNNQTDFNLIGLYSGGRVIYANSPDDYVAWQKMIDDSPDSGVTLAPGGNQSSAVIAYSEDHSISRISLFTDAGAKGKLDFFALKSPSTGGGAVALTGTEPTVSIVLDGTNPRASIDFPTTQVAQLAMRWTPDSGSEGVTIRELNAFNGVTLDTHEVSLNPEAIAQGGNTKSSYDSSKDSSKDVQDPKKNPDPVALGPSGSPYLPGALGFPPSPSLRTPLLPPSSVSP